MQLVIGNPAWSSWSLRPWLVLKRLGVPFEARRVPLRQGEATAAAIAEWSPSGWVPALIDGELTVWDSLAICEYLAERFPGAGLWPAEPAARALGRSACAEMHSGFRAVRMELSMLYGQTAPTPELSEDARREVRRIVSLWGELTRRFGGPWLLGEAWSIADAFYTPVASRFRTYGLRLAEFGDDGLNGGAAQAFVERALATPEALEWERLSLADAA